MLRDFPIGLMVLDWNLRPLWYNTEAAFACSIWNFGERRAAALNPYVAYALPSALAAACADVRRQAEAPDKKHAEAPLPCTRVSDEAKGLHAQIAVGRGATHPSQLAFQIQIDYRRPRGDRHRAVSLGALALLARLSTREREVALKIREGQRTLDIAREFNRSPLTIKAQLSSIFAKFGLRNRAQVAAMLNR